jgi:exoribonuclease R
MRQSLRSAPGYLHGVDRTVNAMFWLCDVVEAKFFDDRFPIYALRKPLQWGDDTSSMEYVVQIADRGQHRANAVSTIARGLKAAYFSGRALDQFVARDLPEEFESLIRETLKGLQGTITRKYYDQRPNYNSLPLVTIDPTGKKVIPSPRLLPKT